MIKMTEMTREEAAKMIKDDIRLHHDDLSGKYRHALNLAIKALEQPEIIRCKDCKHMTFHKNRIPSEQCWVCEYWDFDDPKPDGFCNFAEGREE